MGNTFSAEVQVLLLQPCWRKALHYPRYDTPRQHFRQLKLPVERAKLTALCSKTAAAGVSVRFLKSKSIFFKKAASGHQENTKPH